MGHPFRGLRLSSKDDGNMLAMECGRPTPTWREQLMFQIDRFILQAEVLIPSDPEEDRMALGAIPALRLPSGNVIMLSRGEDGAIWLVSKDQAGVDLEDDMIKTVLKRLEQKHPNWLLKTSCAYCNEEIVLPTVHGYSCNTQTDVHDHNTYHLLTGTNPKKAETPKEGDETGTRPSSHPRRPL